VNQSHGWVGFENGFSPRFRPSVEKISADGRFYFRKNRSTKIEELFSASHPFSRLLTPFLGFEPIGGVISPGPWLGFSEDLSHRVRFSPVLRDQSMQYAIAGGAWLAISTLLGMTEIHSSDVVPVELDDGSLVPFPIDLESIEVPIRMGSETGWLSGGLNAGIDSPYQPREPEVFLDSFLRTAEAMIPVLPEILMQIERELYGQPIRIHLRPTSFYRPYLMGQKRLADVEQPFLVEERIALRARTEPYFFTELGCGELLTVSPEGRIEKVDPQNLTSEFERKRPSARALLSMDRLHQVLKLTSLQIARFYFPKEENKTLCGETFEFNVSDSKIFLKTKRFSVGTPLSS
jgi:hypothetical protein